jgi:hypothetical protein
MINFRWLEKSRDVGNGVSMLERTLQYEGVSDAIPIAVISDAPKDALIGMTDNGLAYFLSEWKDVPIVEDESK